MRVVSELGPGVGSAAAVVDASELGPGRFRGGRRRRRARTIAPAARSRSLRAVSLSSTTAAIDAAALAGVAVEASTRSARSSSSLREGRLRARARRCCVRRLRRGPAHAAPAVALSLPRPRDDPPRELGPHLGAAGRRAHRRGADGHGSYDPACDRAISCRRRSRGPAAGERQEQDSASSVSRGMNADLTQFRDPLRSAANTER